jgi:sulfide:quinone oxidoreductase
MGPDRRPADPAPADVLVAGAGIAGLEAALALRALARDRVRVELLDPSDHLAMAPESTAHPFGRIARQVPLAPLAERAGVGLRRGRLARVDAEGHVALTTDGERIGYDRLVVAVGALRDPVPHGVVPFGGPEDVTGMQQLLGRIVRGARRGILTHLAFVVPPGAGWPLAAYELALQTARHLSRRGVRAGATITLVTAEDTPLAVFGTESSRAVAGDLAEAGIEVRCGSTVRDWAWGRLTLIPSGAVTVDRVVALPSLRGPAVAGLACDRLGFIQAGRDGRVVGVPDVFVVGDAGTFAVKQGGIGCQQADAVASLIARELGAPAEPVPFEPVVRGWLWDGNGGRYMRADLPGGRDESPGVTSLSASLWEPEGKVAGRFLSGFLRDHGGIGRFTDRLAGLQEPA